MDAQELTKVPLLESGGKSLPSRSEINRLKDIANSVAIAGMFPKNCSTADGVFIKLMCGREWGLGPAASLYELDVQDGQVALSAATQEALVRMRGLGVLDLVETDEQHAVVKVHRADWPADRWERVEFNHEKAQKAGLLGKGTWQKYEESMLVARARSLACSKYFPELFMGIGYDPDELGSDDEKDVQLVDTRPDWAKPKPTPPANKVPTASTIETPEGKPVETPMVTTTNPTGPTPQQLGEAKTIIKILHMNNDDWKHFLGRYGKRSLTECEGQEAREIINHLNRVNLIRQLIRPEYANVSAEKWADALAKRGVQRDIDLPAEAVNEIFDKLCGLCTPFDLAKLGIGDPKSGGSGGNALPPSANESLSVPSQQAA